MKNYRAYTRPSRKKDCKILAKVMREEDKKEVMASHGHTPYEALLYSYKVSDFSMSIMYKGEVMAMCGVSKIDDITGSPWLLGSKEFVKRPRVAFTFLRGSSVWVNKYQDKYPLLHNYVHAGNKTSLLWLKHLGFTFLREVQFSNEPFYEFVRIKKDV